MKCHSVSNRTVEIIVLGLISQDIVQGSIHLQCLSDALGQREFPNAVCGIFYSNGSLAYIIIVLVFHILHTRKHTACLSDGRSRCGHSRHAREPEYTGC